MTLTDFFFEICTKIVLALFHIADIFYPSSLDIDRSKILSVYFFRPHVVSSVCISTNRRNQIGAKMTLTESRQSEEGGMTARGRRRRRRKKRRKKKEKIKEDRRE